MKKAFLYPTLRCNTSCKMCYMKNHYSNTIDMPLDYAHHILTELKSCGTERITFLGGEPTLYPYINEVLWYAKEIKLPFIRLQTNGQFSNELFNSEVIIRCVDAFSFSLDGHTEQLNNMSRTGCNFNLLVQNIKNSVKLGKLTSVNIIVTAHNIDYIMDIIDFVVQIGVEVIYINIVFSGGGAKGLEDLFNNIAIKWDKACEQLTSYQCNNKLRIKFPIPINRIYKDKGIYTRNDMDCLYIMPNGDKFTCVMMVDKPEYAIGNAKSKCFFYTNNCPYMDSNQNCIMQFNDNITQEKPRCLYCRQEIIYGGNVHENASIKNSYNAVL